MHRPLTLSLLTLVGVLIVPAYAQRPPVRGGQVQPLWQGDWRWTDPQMPEASHYLRLKGTATKPSGDYAGNEAVEGIAYFKIAVNNLKITTKNEVSFEVGPHGLTRTPLTLKDKNLPVEASSEGLSNVRLYFKGQLNGKVLTLRCKADDDMSCPSATLRFEKMR